MATVSNLALAALLLLAYRGPAAGAIKIAKLGASGNYSNVTHAEDNHTEDARLPQADMDSWHLRPLRSEPPPEVASRGSSRDLLNDTTLGPMQPNAVLVDDSVVDALVAQEFLLRPGDIPKFIHATWISWETLEPNERRFADKWASLNPDWKYYFWDDRAMKKFMRRHLPPDQYQKLVLMKPVEVCDVFRYTVLRRLGGLYMDIDVEPVLPIEQWWGKVMEDPRPQLITGWEARLPNATEQLYVNFSRIEQVQQWLIMSAPHHPILKKVISNIFSLFAQNKPTLELTGPGPWTDAVLGYIADVGAGVPPKQGHGEGRENEVSYRGKSPIHLLPKESFAWDGWPPGVGNSTEILAKHHFKHSWVR